jgi:hypothetical protein
MKTTFFITIFSTLKNLIYIRQKILWYFEFKISSWNFVDNVTLLNEPPKSK